MKAKVLLLVVSAFVTNIYAQNGKFLLEYTDAIGGGVLIPTQELINSKAQVSTDGKSIYWEDIKNPVKEVTILCYEAAMVIVHKDTTVATIPVKELTLQGRPLFVVQNDKKYTLCTLEYKNEDVLFKSIHKEDFGQAVLALSRLQIYANAGQTGHLEPLRTYSVYDGFSNSIVSTYVTNGGWRRFENKVK